MFLLVVTIYSISNIRSHYQGFDGEIVTQPSLQSDKMKAIKSSSTARVYKIQESLVHTSVTFQLNRKKLGLKLYKSNFYTFS